MGLFGQKLDKKEVRKELNKIDKILVDIVDTTNAGIDKVMVNIDAELKASGRELENSEKLLAQIPQAMTRLAQQVGPDAPTHIKNVLASVTEVVNATVSTIAGNLKEVRQNIVDVDKHTDKVDELTDEVKLLARKIDDITDQFQD